MSPGRSSIKNKQRLNQPIFWTHHLPANQGWIIWNQPKSLCKHIHPTRPIRGASSERGAQSRSTGLDLGYSPKKRGKMLVLLNIAPMNLITWYSKYLRTHVYTHILYIYYHHTYIYAYCGISWCLDWEVGNISHHAWQNQYLSLNWICQKSNSRKNAHKISSFAVDQNSFPPRYPGAIASRVPPNTLKDPWCLLPNQSILLMEEILPCK